MVMRSQRSVATSIVASVALAALTLGVFANSQLRGPEGTINRYFEAIQNEDYNAAAALCVSQDPDDSTRKMQFVYLTNTFRQLFVAGARYDIVHVVRGTGATARAGVVFSSDRYRDLPMIISLRRVGRTWMIDMEGTLQPYRLPT